MNKRFFRILSGVVFLLLCSVIACTQQENSQELRNEALNNHESAVFLKSINANLYAIASTSVESSFGTRANVKYSDLDSTAFTTLHVDFPEDATEEEKRLLDYVKTVQDLAVLKNMTAAELSFIRNGTVGENNIVLSTEAARKSLKPTVETSRQYLLSQDITPSQLDDIIRETGATDEDIIMVAMILSSEDYKQQVSGRVQDEPLAFNLFATKCYAGELEFGFKAVVSCAATVMGANLLRDLEGLLGKKAYQKWSLKVIKRIFIHVAKRYLGPVGVAITAIEFTGCMVGAYSLHSCSIYATPEMQREMEKLRKNKEMEEALKKEKDKGRKLHWK